MKMKLFGLTETKLFHLHKIFQNGGWGGGVQENHLNPSGSATKLRGVKKLTVWFLHLVLASREPSLYNTRIDISSRGR